MSAKSLEEHFLSLQEAHQILDEPQFLMSDVVKITGATGKAITHMLDPKHERVNLMGDHVNPGKGRRRMFAGGDVLKIAAAYCMSAIGFPQRFSIKLTDEVQVRAAARISGLAEGTDLMLATYPMADGDWAVERITKERDDDAVLPVAVQVFWVDRFIDETLAQLYAMSRDEEVPDFKTPPVEVPQSPYSPENDFFRMWGKNSHGQPILVGLNWKETQEYLHYVNMPNEHSSEPVSTERYIDLSRRHEHARISRIAEEIEARETS